MLSNLLSRFPQLTTRINKIHKSFSTDVFVWRRWRFITEAMPATKHVKHKAPKKRANILLRDLKNEEYLKLRSGREWEKILPGDSVEVERLPYMTSPTTEIVKGVVIAKRNKFSDTNITIINAEYGVPVSRTITMYNPLVKNIRVLQRAFIHEGKKRVRRSKLYYLMKRDPREYTVTLKWIMIMASSRKLEKEDPEPSIDRLLSISDRTAAEIKNLPEKGTQKQKHFVCLDAEELLIPLLENESLQQAHNEQFQKFVLACSMNLSMVSEATLVDYEYVNDWPYSSIISKDPRRVCRIDEPSLGLRCNIANLIQKRVNLSSNSYECPEKQPSYEKKEGKNPVNSDLCSQESDNSNCESYDHLP